MEKYWAKFIKKYDGKKPVHILEVSEEVRKVLDFLSVKTKKVLLVDGGVAKRYLVPKEIGLRLSKDKLILFNVDLVKTGRCSVGTVNLVEMASLKDKLAMVISYYLEGKEVIIKHRKRAKENKKVN